jgi:hypothetical protein
MSGSPRLRGIGHERRIPAGRTRAARDPASDGRAGRLRRARPEHSRSAARCRVITCHFLSGAAPDAFTDDNGNLHETNINLVAKAGITTGCGGGKYCPSALVTREQMAAFLRRAFGSH